MSSIKSKKGHFILEAAIFLPIFVLAFLAIGQLINIAGVRNAVMHSASDEVSKVARFSYKVKQADIYRKKVSDRVISSAKGALSATRGSEQRHDLVFGLELHIRLVDRKSVV